ncbi:mycothione reductase [Streptomyces yangpuensis]|uniref:mycothione reductase n=1 Tax=Streptomyces yangpuensis TaxID=1648182 RepID=UPI0037112882
MRHHDLVVIGAGSGNAVVDDSFTDLDVAIVEERWFGGTCLNAGCIPSKMLARTAHVARTVREAGTYDVDPGPGGVRWRAARDRVFRRLDAEREQGRRGREGQDFVTVYEGRARFTGPRTLHIEPTGTGTGALDIDAAQVVVAAGGRPLIPPPVAESGLPYETSDTVMRLDDPPRRLAILGGGYIAAELAEVFAATGSAVTIVEKEQDLLGPQDETVAQRFTQLVRSRYDLRLGRELTAVGGRPGALRLTLDDGSTAEADMLLVAAGRIPNSDRLNLRAAGIATHDDGRVIVDSHQRTSAEGVFALGDISSPVPLKHLANREAKVVAHNLRHPDDLTTCDHDLVPAAVFTQPQIASVGATEQDCRARGLDYAVGTAEYGDTAYGWALEDTTGFCKVLTEPGSGRLLGAHILGAQAPTLIQPLVLAMTLGIDAATLARCPYWIHPALTEVVENALLDLDP